MESKESRLPWFLATCERLFGRTMTPDERMKLEAAFLAHPGAVLASSSAAIRQVFPGVEPPRLKEVIDELDGGSQRLREAIAHLSVILDTRRAAIAKRQLRIAALTIGLGFTSLFAAALFAKRHVAVELKMSLLAVAMIASASLFLRGLRAFRRALRMRAKSSQ